MLPTGLLRPVLRLCHYPAVSLSAGGEDVLVEDPVSNRPPPPRPVNSVIVIS